MSRLPYLAGAIVIGLASIAAAGAGTYPATFTALAQTTTGSTTVTSTIKISIERLMMESRHTRVVDALKYGGYANFLNTLRPFPVIGSIATDKNQVDVRYAWESEVDGHRRVVLVADRPLFFLGGGTDKQRAGYELTVIELIFDDSGGATGTIAGAARVKPAPEGGVILGDFAEAPVRLTIRGTTE